MVKLIRQGVYYTEEGRIVKEAHAFMTSDKKEKAVLRTISYGILHAHGGIGGTLQLKFDAAVAEASVFAGAAQTAKKASLPCIIMGEAEEDALALEATKQFGGEFVPAYLAEARQYTCECVAKGGAMLLCAEKGLGLGALGAMGVCADGEALAALLSGQAYKVEIPQIVAVYLKGKLRKGVGPTDVALALAAAVSKNAFAQGKILEFIGPGVANLTMDARMGIDAFTPSMGCLSTVWETDNKTREFYKEHGREGDFVELRPVRPTYYDAAVTVDLSRVEPMFAFAADPAGAVPLAELISDPAECLSRMEKAAKKRGVALDLGGLQESLCASGAAIAGGYEDIATAAELLRGKAVGGQTFALFVRPASTPVARGLSENGYLAALLDAGAVFGAPCCGAYTGGLFLCNVLCAGTGEGTVALMDARSIAVAAENGGTFALAEEQTEAKRLKKYKFSGEAYKNRVYRQGGAQ